MVLDKPGSPEFINEHYGDRYFSEESGFAESLHVFVRGNSMAGTFAASRHLRVAETGFGSGLNLCTAVWAVQSLGVKAGDGAPAWLEWTSVEKYPLETAKIRQILGSFPELGTVASAFLAAWEPQCLVKQAWNECVFGLPGLQVRLKLYWGDVLDMFSGLEQAVAEAPLDCWVLDGHSPALNPDMWSPAVFDGLARCSSPAVPTRFATYTAAGMVKAGLRAAGFRVRRLPGYGRKRHMISGEYAGR